MPSRAMLHSGRSLFHLEGAGQSIPRVHTTLGQSLRANGYRTYGSGKWHNGREAFNRSFSDGAEIFFGGMTDHWNMPAYNYDPTGEYSSRLKETLNWFDSNEIRERQADHIHAGQHSTDILGRAAAEFIRSYEEEAPFFLYLSFLAPHDPRTMPDVFLNMYEPDDIELPPNFTGGHPFDNGALHIRDEELAGFPRTTTETRRHLAEYYAMITHLDSQVGDILHTLEAKGILNDTILVFAGDNGLAVGQHGLFGKQSCYEHSVRVPLIFAGPGVPRGQQSDAYAYLFDIFPTLCELTDTEKPISVEGTSLVSAMTDKEQKVRDTLYFAYTNSQRAVKDRQYKLIEYVVGGRHNMTQLFDLQNDPWELNNLACAPAHSDKLVELRAELRRYSEDWDDRSSEWGEVFWPVFEASVNA